MKNKEKNFASAVIYVRNAEHRIEDFLSSVINVMEEYFEHSEIICVNDCSDDRSVDIIRQTAEIAGCTSISVINLSYFHGLEIAMNAGLDLSIGDFVFEFDNTYLDFDPDVIMQIYFRSLKGYDIVSASPNQHLRITSKLFYKVFNRHSYIAANITTESFRVLSRRAINRISPVWQNSCQ